MHPVIYRQQGLQDYLSAMEAMQRFTQDRGPATPDEIWCLQHPPVFTQGIGGKPEHALNPGDIPVLASDRGGQITYHGPGQLVMYTLLDLKRRNIGIRTLVHQLEQCLIDLLATYHIQGERRAKAPGVYVAEAKIASIGLRIKNGCCYHGVALNVSLDLEPFSRINPCGFQQLKITQISDLGGPHDLSMVAGDLITITQGAMTQGHFTKTNSPQTLNVPMGS